MGPKRTPSRMTCPHCGKFYEQGQSLFLTETQRRLFEYLRLKFTPTTLPELCQALYGRSDQRIKNNIQLHMSILRNKIDHHPYFTLSKHPYVLLRKRNPDDLNNEKGLGI